jgi:DNA polymerase-3 subunit alpha
MDCFGHHRSELLAVYDTIMDSVASSRKRNLEGQMGLFGMLEDDDTAAAIPIPKLPEIQRAERMLMEKETTGIYISGHPMDDYRSFLVNTHVIPIGKLMDEESVFQDDQIVSVAGIVQSIKMKTTRNNSMMAYITVEDNTASIEMLAFSSVLNQYGGYIKENQPVVVTGRLSLRDEKEPQIVINRARPITDFSENTPAAQLDAPKQLNGTLYLRLTSESDPMFRKVKAMINMFPGEKSVVVYFADTKARRGSRCELDVRLIRELENVLGKENVVMK